LWIFNLWFFNVNLSVFRLPAVQSQLGASGSSEAETEREAWSDLGHVGPLGSKRGTNVVQAWSTGDVGLGVFFVFRKKHMIETTCMLIDVDQSRLLVQVQELLARKLICKSLEFSLRVNISKIFFCINFSRNGSLPWPFPMCFPSIFPCQVALCHRQIWLKTWTKLSQSKARQWGISPWKFNSEFSTEK